MLSEEICKVVSSANSRAKRHFDELARSFIRIRNRIGPKIEP